MNTAFYPFSLQFDGLCSRFPFMYEGEPVVSTGALRGNGGRPAPLCLISGREAGDMVFKGNHSETRKTFFDSQGILAEKVYSLIQIHSKDVYSVSAPLPGLSAFTREGDGMVSFAPGVFLAVTVADCLPVFLLDTENGYWAVIHSGWKGTGIAANAVEMMKRAGSRPEALAAVLGPCIQDCCYRVDEDRAKRFEEEFACTQDNSGFPFGKVSRHDKSGWYIGLQAANAHLLADAGVRHIAHCTDCTFTDERLGSYRRQGPEAYTRMIAMAG